MSRQFGPCGEITVQDTGGDVVDSVSIGNQAASGSSGELFNITCPAGKRIIITGLMPDTTAQTDIEVKFGIRAVHTGSISDSIATGSLTIAQAANVGTNEYLAVSTMAELKGDYEEDLIITKTSSTTSAAIYLSYKIAY